MLIFTPFATMLTAGQNEASQIAGVREVKEEENSSARRSSGRRRRGILALRGGIFSRYWGGD